MPYTSELTSKRNTDSMIRAASCRDPQEVTSAVLLLLSPPVQPRGMGTKAHDPRSPYPEMPGETVGVDLLPSLPAVQGQAFPDDTCRAVVLTFRSHSGPAVGPK
jgi:hypothetical protein